MGSSDDVLKCITGFSDMWNITFSSRLYIDYQLDALIIIYS